jgi:CheY-like chemotaxis protein
MTSVYKKILLIEDDRDDQQLFSLAIEDFSPIEFNIASNGHEAISFITPENMPDIIFLDLNMPVMDGKEFMKLIKKNNTFDGPIIILSTSASEEDMLECRILGTNNFLVKPNTYGELSKMISSVLAGECEIQDFA